MSLDTDDDTTVDILVVDDNSNNVLALEAMLASLGQNVVRANSGTEALRHLLERDFALVLLDIQMPGLDGFQTAQLIRARKRSRQMPIIFVTAFVGDEVNTAQGYELGAVDFLCKPISPVILRAKVQVFVDLHRKTLALAHQAKRLRDSEHREHERQLAAAAQRFESEHLRAEMSKERSIAVMLAKTVSEREHAEEALQRSNVELSLRNTELANADRRKDEFLAMLAHELRNPLAPIVNAAQLLRQPSASPEVRERALDALDRQAAQLVRLVDDLLDLSRITTGKIELRRELVTLTAIVNHAVQTSAPLMEQWHHDFSVWLPPYEVTLHADRTRLGQVVSNLLNNAAKYSPPGTRIELEAERVGGELIVRVRDEGMGIKTDMLQAVFGLFVQSERTLDRAQGGLGIGLTLVKNLVEMHGGTVTAHSAGLDKGSVFTVRLPTAEGSAPLSLVPPAPTVSATPRRVTVVEDDPDIRETMTALLDCWGHEVSVACDGPSGVEAVLTQRPDLAFIDIGLPGLDGYQVVAALRTRAPELATRLIAVTGYGRPEDRALALAAGFDDHVVKPMASAVLLKLLERH